jgi:hypothetical protein
VRARFVAVEHRSAFGAAKDGLRVGCYRQNRKGEGSHNGELNKTPLAPSRNFKLSVLQWFKLVWVAFCYVTDQKKALWLFLSLRQSCGAAGV